MADADRDANLPNDWASLTQCPWCEGEVEWFTIDPTDPDVGPEEILVCHQCGELTRHLKELVFDEQHIS